MLSNLVSFSSGGGGGCDRNGGGCGGGFVYELIFSKEMWSNVVEGKRSSHWCCSIHCDSVPD